MAKKRSSRTQRWQDAAAKAREAYDALGEGVELLKNAMQELADVQEEYQEWKDNLPDNLESSALGEKLDTITQLDLQDVDLDNLGDVDNVISEAESADLPLGFGRD